tara:strand:- start:99 stop:1109 length:1011 start_codon:yes stop_codon:yes gene_type:complete
MTHEITDIITELKARLKSIESKIVFNHSPIAPRKPHPPRKDKVLTEGRPAYFQINGIILNAVAWLLPIIYVQFAFFELHFEVTALLVGIAALVTRLIVHLKETEDFDRKTKAYNLSLKQYEDKLRTYNIQQTKYNTDLKNYQIVKQQNDILKREKAEIQEELDSIYKILGDNKSKLSAKEKRLYIESLINREPMIGKVNRGSYNSDFEKSNSEPNESELNQRIKKGIDFISKLSEKQRKRILNLLEKVQDVQKSNMESSQKTAEIKRILWTDQSSLSKLFIGGLLGTVCGLMIFGTGGIGIAGLGGAVGIWGFLTGTAGGVLVSSLIQNFEKRGGK